MALSKVDIINSALVRMGEEPISDDTDDSVRARVMLAEYPRALRHLTRSHPWRHATAYSILAAITPKPAEIYDFSNVFALPTDCLRSISTSLDPMARWSEIEGGRLACDSSALTLKYIKLVEDEDKFSENFIQVLTWLLAKNCCYAITNSVDRAKDCAANYEEELKLARSFDAQIGMLDRVQSDGFTRSRRY